MIILYTVKTACGPYQNILGAKNSMPRLRDNSLYYIYIHTYIHTYIYIYIYMYVCIYVLYAYTSKTMCHHAQTERQQS
jgi:hypothetical protein